MLTKPRDPRRLNVGVLVWLENQDHQQYAAAWPNGFTARFDPELQLLDASRGLIAREGALLQLGGAPDERFSNLFKVWEINGVLYGCW